MAKHKAFKGLALKGLIISDSVMINVYYYYYLSLIHISEPTRPY